MRPLTASSPWLPAFRPKPHARVRCFCFPYAGGRASIFAGWPAALPDFIDVRGVELPGRGARRQEPPLRRLADVLAGLLALVPALVEPFAFFGHSMGARIAFHFADRLARQGGPTPCHVFVSGCTAPSAPRDCTLSPDAADEDLIASVRDMGGTPPGLLADAEFLALLLPMLRADLAVDQSPCPAWSALPCPLSVFSGTADTFVPEGTLDLWRSCTQSRFALRMLPGGHFFLHSAQAMLLEAIASDLASSAGGEAPVRFAVGGGRLP